MTLINFDDDVIVATAPTVIVETPTLVVTEHVHTTPVPSATHVMAPVEEWGWEELRDYVVSSIEKTHGPFPRNMKTEHSIFKSFAKRWGSQAGPIARYAFEVSDGMWRGAPISVNRFCLNSDTWFAEPILARLNGGS